MIGSSIASDLGDFAEGANVYIDAGLKDGYTFTGWTCPETIAFDDAASVKTFFNMVAKAISITATWLATHSTRLEECKKAIEANIDDTEWKWNNTDGDVSNIVNTTIAETDTEIVYVINDENTTTTAPTDKTTGNIGYDIDLKLDEDVLNMTGDIVLPIVPQAEWAYTCSVTGSDTLEDSIVKYLGGTVVTINAGAPAPGKLFKQWETESGITLEDVTSATTIFTMPFSDVAFNATWSMIDYTVTMDETCDIVGEGGTTYNVGDNVAVTCNSPEFVEWSCNEPTVTFVDKTNRTTTFTMPAANITLDHSFKTYTLIIESDGSTTTGGGSYMAGVTVNIDAGAKDDYSFTGWTSATEGVVFADAASIATTISMTASDAVVTANWKKNTYTVTVEGNGVTDPATFGAGVYESGDTVQLSNAADATRYLFTEWSCTAGDVVLTDKTNAASSFAMPRNNVTMTFVAIKGAVANQCISKDGVDPVVTDVLGFKNINNVVTVTTAAIKGYTFTGWTCESGLVSFANATALSTTFTMPDTAPVDIVANYTSIVYTITMDDSCNTATGDGEFNYGDTVTVICNSAEFVEWSCDDPSVTFADKTAATTTFVMPANNIAVDHSFKSYTVAVVSEGCTTTGAGSYLAAAKVNISTTAKANHVFLGWTSNNAGVVFADAKALSTSFNMVPGNVTITATWQAMYTVTVTGSSLSAAENGAGSYTPGTEVTAKAGTPAAGMIFSGWDCTTGNVTPL